VRPADGCCLVVSQDRGARGHKTLAPEPTAGRTRLAAAHPPVPRGLGSAQHGAGGPRSANRQGHIPRQGHPGLIAVTRQVRTVRIARTTDRTGPEYGTTSDAPVEEMEGPDMSNTTSGCPCGCTQQVEAGCSYAGGNERERETHRARANRQREAQDRRRQARETEAQGVLAEIGLDAEAPAHALAQAMEATADRLQRLAIVVGRDLETCDLDQQRENLQVLRAEHRASLQGLQERLDETSRLRRATEQRLLEAEAATSQAKLAAAEANTARSAAVQGREDAERELRTSTARAEEDATLASSSLRAADQLAEQLAAADTARAEAKKAQALAEDAASRALCEVRAQQLRTAEILADQEQRAAANLTAALALADRRAVRDRRASVREVRDSLLRDRDQLRADLAVARRELEAANDLLANPPADGRGLIPI